jgi:hypothetical protein
MVVGITILSFSKTKALSVRAKTGLIAGFLSPIRAETALEPAGGRKSTIAGLTGRDSLRCAPFHKIGKY